MSSKVILLITGLILCILACKEDVENDQSQEQEQEIGDALIPVIPERPSEIEVIDLTDEVALFVVIAGAYSSPTAARKKAEALKKAGFTNADIVQRPGSKLYSALVERFDSESEAREFASEIATNNEIKSYVYKLDD